MQLVKNALGRMVPTEVNGQPAIPFPGVGRHRPSGHKACPQIPTCLDYPEDGNKVVADLRTASRPTTTSATATRSRSNSSTSAPKWG
jgi:hypothetical protein